VLTIPDCLRTLECMKRRIAPPLLAVLVLGNAIVWAHELSVRPLPIVPHSGACKPMPATASPVKSVETSFQNWNQSSGSGSVGLRTRIPCDCSDCTLVMTYDEFHCERVPLNDCGNWWNFFDDDFRWKARYNVFNCPDGHQYRKCGLWAMDGCCTGGSTVAPPPTCDPLNGRDPCHTRSTPCPNNRAALP